MMLLVGDWAPGPNKVDIATPQSAIFLANLEGPILPLGHSYTTASKAGPHLCSNRLPHGEHQLLFSLANNHIMDYGISGLQTTLKNLNQRGFKACGAGQNLEQARKPLLIKDNGNQFGIISCCEAQFGIARHNQPGVAEFGTWVTRSIHELSKKVDAVIVSVHAGIEESPWPIPYIRELYRSFIDAGAKVVHGHHSHVPQGFECYGSGLIFYGMGNYAVDPYKWSHYTNTMWSLGAQIDLSCKPLKWRPLTFTIRHHPKSDSIIIENSKPDQWTGHQRYLDTCNMPFADRDLFEALWHEVAMRIYWHHGARYMGFHSLPQRSRKQQVAAVLSSLKGRLLDRARPVWPSQQDYLLWYHLFACESHRQMLTTALGLLAGEIKDLRNDKTRKLVDEMMPGYRESEMP